jgi:general secretion pathway protein E
LIDELKLNLYADRGELTLYQATGCDHCKGNGYIGRRVVTELLTLSEPIRRLILSRADGTSIQNTAIKSGMDTMQIDGIKKALLGITTIEDVMRVTQQI